jgi:phenylpyruvate tautomerase PptA (4-oxalocrotonate tautomerase family)
MPTRLATLRTLLYFDVIEGRTRSDRMVIIHVVSRRRSRAQKERLYALLAERLRRDCGLDPADLIVSVTENDDEDWLVLRVGPSSVPDRRVALSARRDSRRCRRLAALR